MDVKNVHALAGQKLQTAGGVKNFSTSKLTLVFGAEIAYSANEINQSV
jgi:hypothetical protein